MTEIVKWRIEYRVDQGARSPKLTTASDSCRAKARAALTRGLCSAAGSTMSPTASVTRRPGHHESSMPSGNHLIILMIHPDPVLVALADVAREGADRDVRRVD